MPRTYFDYFAPDQSKAPAAAPPAGPAPSAGPPPIGALPGPPKFAQGPPGGGPPSGYPPGQPPPPGGYPPAPPPPGQQGPPGGGGFDPNWFVQNVDDRIPAPQWQAWYNAGLYDPATKKWKSSKVDKNGVQIPGLFDKPDDCPPGMQAFGANQCRPEAEVAAITAQQNAQKAGLAAGAIAPPSGSQPFDAQAFLQQILPLLMGFYGGGQAKGAFLPGTSTQLNSGLPFNPYGGYF